MSIETWALILSGASLLIGGGGLAAWFRFRSDAELGRAQTARTEAETDNILTTAAETALRISATAIQELEKEREEDRRRIEKLEHELAEQRRRRYELAKALDDEQTARARLADRVEALENWIKLNTSHDPEWIK